MATNTSSIAYKKTNSEDLITVPACHCIPWLVVFGIESLAIVILNAITIIVFVKQRQLQRKSTYLIIHLAIVDFFVGAVTGPLHIEFLGSWSCGGLWEHVSLGHDSSWLLELGRAYGKTMYPISLLNLAFISLERAHATFRPFKHRFVNKRVFGVIITVTWLALAVMLATWQRLLNSFGFSLKLFPIILLYFSIPLFVILVCYVSIYIKVRHGLLPQHHGTAGLRERKLTSTLFLAIFGSLFTFLPHVVFWITMVFDFKLLSGLSLISFFHINMAMPAFCLLNSLINPIIYAIRMPELRTGILQIISRRAPRRSNGANIPLADR